MSGHALHEALGQAFDAAMARVGQIERDYPDGDAPQEVLDEHALLSDSIIAPTLRARQRRVQAALDVSERKPLSADEVDRLLGLAEAAMRAEMRRTGRSARQVLDDLAPAGGR